MPRLRSSNKANITFSVAKKETATLHDSATRRKIEQVAFSLHFRTRPGQGNSFHNRLSRRRFSEARQGLSNASATYLTGQCLANSFVGRSHEVSICDVLEATPDYTHVLVEQSVVAVSKTELQRDGSNA